MTPSAVAKLVALREMIEASRNGFLDGQPYILTYSDIIEELHNVEALATAPREERQAGVSAEALAQRFHYLYESLAPQFGYETRKDSAVAWEKVPEKNRKLMIAVCEQLLATAPPEQAVQQQPCDCKQLCEKAAMLVNPLPPGRFCMAEAAQEKMRAEQPETYPGQAFFHKHNANIKRAEERAAQPQPASDGARSELEQEYGKDHPWHHFDYWHKDFHEHAPGGPIEWPCRQPLRCFWRWTRKTGATLNQNGIAKPLVSHDQKVRDSLQEPMACGHFQANLQPCDEGPETCIVCAEMKQHDQKVRAEVLEEAQKVYDEVMERLNDRLFSMCQNRAGHLLTQGEINLALDEVPDEPIRSLAAPAASKPEAAAHE